MKLLHRVDRLLNAVPHNTFTVGWLSALLSRPTLLSLLTLPDALIYMVQRTMVIVVLAGVALVSAENSSMD